MSTARIVGLLFDLLAAGCAGLERVPPGESPQIGVTRGASVAPEPAAPPAQPMNKGSTPEPPQAGATESRTRAVQPIDPPAAPSVTPATDQLATKADSPAPKTQAKLVAPPAATEQVPNKESAAPAPQKQAPPPLDPKFLETPLEETEASGVSTKLEPPQAGATDSRTVAVQPIGPLAASSVTPSTGQLAAKADSPAPKTPAKVVSPAAPTERVPRKDSAAPAPVKQAPPPLDLKSLETRLKETEAIGVFTKLALKNQVDDLLDTFRAFYKGRIKTTLDELRRPYDLLLLKVLALLQDSDPPLAAAIVASREAIWGILADPDKFTTL